MLYIIYPFGFLNDIHREYLYFIPYLPWNWFKADRYYAIDDFVDIVIAEAYRPEEHVL